MSKSSLPRISEISVGSAPLTLQVSWRHGEKTLVNVSNIINTFRIYEPLRNDPALFARVRTGEYGSDVVWTDAIDMAADTLWRLAREQADGVLTPVGSRA